MKTNLQALLLLYLMLLFSSSLAAQVSFANANHLLAPQDRNSGTALGIADMNGDGLDDILRLNLARTLYIDYQNAQGTEMPAEYIAGQFVQKQWMLTVGDVDNNGFNDLMMGGFDDTVKIYFADALGQNYASNLFPGPRMFAQGANFVDINNDGLLDAFVCHDDGTNRIWEGNGDGTFTQANQWIDLTILGSSDNSGNYGSIWTDIDRDNDLDLYVTKCKEGATSPLNPDRINVLYVNDGTGQYTEQGLAKGLASNRQSWTSEFQDIDNDGDFDCFITNHDDKNNLTADNHELLENDGNGFFTNIMEDCGIDSTGYAFQALFRDFDNDGWLDLLIGGVEAAFFYNNGDPDANGRVSFTRSELALPGDQPFQSFTVGDLNHDGFLDVYTSYMDGLNRFDVLVGEDSLWLNQGNDNHFLVVKLEGLTSNRNGVGAKIVVHANGLMQTREVRAGESYGIQTTFNQYFGLKETTTVDSLSVWWPSGEREVFTNIPADQFLYLKEKTCVSPPAHLELSGDRVLCEGEVLTISAPPGFTYAWSTGEESASIEVTKAGSYNVTVTDGSTCPGISRNITVLFEPDQTPAIKALGPTVACAGQPVVLQASASPNYLWSTGAETPQVEVNRSGKYWVEVAGYCQNFTSDSIAVLINEVAVVGFGDTILTVGSGLLRGEGDSLYWYDRRDGGELLGRGAEFATPLVEEDTEFWLESRSLVPLPTFFAGKKKRGEAGSYRSSGINGLTMRIEEPVLLKSFKVYAEYAGLRKFNIGGPSQPPQEISVDIPAGESRVEVNLLLPKCEDCQIFVTEDVGLFSDDALADFPYPIQSFGAITGSKGSGYGFFYDWEMSSMDSIICISERIPVVLNLRDNDVANPPGTILVFPNPNTGLLSIKKDTRNFASIYIHDLSGRLVYENILEPTALHELDLSFLADGMYIIRLIVEEQTFIQKFLLQR